MPIRVSPTTEKPTHHISLKDRRGKTVGLILCDDKGQPVKDPAAVFQKNPVDTTAQKQTSGNSSYESYEYPYTPIVQDDWSGGRGNLDFERDSTKYFDSFRARTSRQNKAYAGPQETYATGIRSLNQNMPGSVSWHKLIGTQRYLYYRFTASASFTAGLVWLLVRRRATPANLTIAIYSDSAGNVGSSLESITVAYTRLEDTLMEWINETISEALTSGTAYWLVINAEDTDDNSKHWMIGVKGSSGSTYTSEDFDSTPTAISKDLYFRLTEANSDKTCIPFDYKEGKYFVINGTSGAPKLYIAGDRGTADANTGQLTKLIDATKAWTTNEWAGYVVKVIDGTGSTEPQPWRTITSNTATELTLDSAWTITHDTTTEYVIYGVKLTELTGHGLTAPVTDVLVTTKGIILFAQGDSVNIRRAKYETSAGTWTASYADDGTNKAIFLEYKPQAQKIVKANNRDATNDTSVALADPVDWTTASHTFGTAVKVDSKYVRITGMAVYPDEGGTEAVWVFKEDLPFIVPGTGNPYPLNLQEMRTVRSEKNGRNPLVHNVYLYFPLGYGLQRYYGGTIDDVGPNSGEGLPTNRRGAINYMVGYPGKFFASIDPGTSGYACILESGGWHERYRAPKGQRISMMSFQVTPGELPDRMWVYQGNDLLFLPFPSDTVNELEDENYTFAPEFSITFARMHAGLFDVMKVIRKLKLQTENLEADSDTGEPICWIEVDYKLNQDTEWYSFDDIFLDSPTQEVDFGKQPEYGLAAKRLQFRIRGYTTDNTKTPVLLALIINSVLRTDVKYIYGPVQFRLMDSEPTLQGTGETDDLHYAKDKREQMENWADASTDSMLWMESISDIFHGKMIFANVPNFRQVLLSNDPANEFKRAVYIGTVSFQEA